MSKILKEQTLLEDLNDQELAKISKIIQKLKFKKGEHIFREKEDTKGLYLIKTGKVEIAKVTSDGWKQTLAVFTKGHFFGELSILEQRKHQAFAIASENTELFLISKEDFEKMEKEISPIAFKILKKLALVMCMNVRRMNDKFLNALISY
jgi:CRP-like cAMP-binding protein